MKHKIDKNIRLNSEDTRLNSNNENQNMLYNQQQLILGSNRTTSH